MFLVSRSSILMSLIARCPACYVGQECGMGLKSFIACLALPAMWGRSVEWVWNRSLLALPCLRCGAGVWNGFEIVNCLPCPACNVGQECGMGLRSFIACLALPAMWGRSVKPTIARCPACNVGQECGMGLKLLTALPCLRWPSISADCASWTQKDCGTYSAGVLSNT